MRLSKEKTYLYMAKKSLSQQQLAEKAGISRQTLSAVLNGRNCRPDLLGKISRALETEPENIIE